MITVLQFRDKGRGEEYAYDPIERTVGQTLQHFIYYELGYGGVITKLSSTSVTVVTRFMGCTDTSTFNGAESDMALLVQVATIAVHVIAIRNEKQNMDKIAEKAIKFTKGNPLLLDMSAGMFLGEGIAKTTALMLLGAENEDELRRAAKLPIKDLIALVELIRLESVSFDDAMSLAS